MILRSHTGQKIQIRNAVRTDAGKRRSGSAVAGKARRARQSVWPAARPTGGYEPRNVETAQHRVDIPHDVDDATAGLPRGGRVTGARNRKQPESARPSSLVPTFPKRRVRRRAVVHDERRSARSSADEDVENAANACVERFHTNGHFGRFGTYRARPVTQDTTFVRLYSGRMDVVVRTAEQVTPRIKSFELADPAGAELPEFTAGSHVDVTLPNGLVRSYSLLNDSRERNRYVIAVLREEAGGGGSAWVHEALKPGDVISITEPQNRFEIDEGGDHNFLIAGGIGITPILSMAERFDELGIDFKLYYCTRNRAETAFAEHIERRFGGRHVLHHDQGAREQSLDVDALLADRQPGTHVYVCGPPGLIAAVRHAAREWPKGTVHFELFGAGRIEIPSENKPFEVHLKRRNVTLHVPPDRTILEVLTENEVRVRSICRDGYCEACTTRYVGGKVEHRDSVLDEDDRKMFLQVCVSRGVPGELLVLDL
jgi:ferredoxin-NADP reductase